MRADWGFYSLWFFGVFWCLASPCVNIDIFNFFSHLFLPVHEDLAQSGGYSLQKVDTRENKRQVRAILLSFPRITHESDHSHVTIKRRVHQLISQNSCVKYYMLKIRLCVQKVCFWKQMCKFYPPDKYFIMHKSEYTSDYKCAFLFHMNSANVSLFMQLVTHA